MNWKKKTDNSTKMPLVMKWEASETVNVVSPFLTRFLLFMWPWARLNLIITLTWLFKLLFSFCLLHLQRSGHSTLRCYFRNFEYPPHAFFSRRRGDCTQYAVYARGWRRTILFIFWQCVFVLQFLLILLKWISLPGRKWTFHLQVMEFGRFKKKSNACS